MKTILVFFGLVATCLAHPIEFHNDPFRQMEEVWPTPTESRIASGAPGPKYWQQRADYNLEITLDEKKDLLTGKARIVYHNHSPHTLKYLWMQLDRNRFTPGSMGHQTSGASPPGKTTFDSFESLLLREVFDGGFKIDTLCDDRGTKLKHRIVDTMMRVDLPQPLKSGQKFTYRIDWHYTITDSRTIGGRSNMEKFEKGGKIFEIAQWYPRVCAYTDVRGWQNKNFQGRGEFALEFGNYKVAITVPENHVVASTGELKNPDKVLKPKWKERLKIAETVKEPMFIVTPKEAAENEESKSGGTKTWIFEAENVRDFAWASSKKFIWDAVRHKLTTNQKPVWAMSYYPNEAEPLWSKYSTHSIMHTLNVYSRFTFDYPYPVAISVNGPVYGMEYPMICFNGPRPEKDGTYSEKTKNGLISVIIHEVGHNWFPMIVNSDERQWSWMDEGLNTFLQMLTEQEWRHNYPSRATPRNIISYMTSGYQRPIMTNSESILQFGPNAYSKPATGLSILRETILGREIFDDAFKEFSTRWMFKNPEPADFFRTMEDAAGVDLDWFWHSWFYTTKHVDIAVTNFERHVLDPGDPDDKADKSKKEKKDADGKNIVAERNKDIPKYVDQNKKLRDFYDKKKDPKVTDEQRDKFKEMIRELEPRERKLLKTKKHITIARFENRGGVIMPLLVELHLENGKKITRTIPAEIWKKNHQSVSKHFITTKAVVKIVLDPGEVTADANKTNNVWPPQIEDVPFSLRKKSESFNNEMKKDREKKAAERKKKEEEKKKAVEKQKESAKKNEPAMKVEPAKKVTPAKKLESSEKKEKPVEKPATEKKPDKSDSSKKPTTPKK
jgi:hypothetical protein